ncbi:uncharacterized protein F4807DRAFT_29334 [Annulohypoxylon truncatum]|uniref:uncharacterized protein n=1 Tax=Annulohypoxylon truncatum TaxID=327061 RepID=UPI0020085840|nr:uncharacterized protein F4807DRAFT_29334 [Annulohypoxylon truncatum]KAI1211236.1 hypothetical protein F4807DRAFT_29334 [Annulohypoxylon truncatum]
MDPRHLYRSVSTVSTATVWTQRTLSGMGLTTSNNTLANTEDDVENIDLQPLSTPEQELDVNPTDVPQNTATQVQEGEDNRGSGPDNRDTISNSKSSTAKSMRLTNIWWLEIVSCLLVVAMIAALVGTIQPYQGQPLSRWPYSLPINTIVSFYSEVMRAAMVLVLGDCLSQLKWSWFTSPRPLHHLEHYDNASRGPWGSLGFLWAIRLRAILPSIGGIMMVLSVLLVPFTQQIVQFYSCTILDATLSASIPKTNFASAGYNGAAVSIVPSAQAVINSGVYDSEIKQVPFTCPTGNCTFARVYRSMGWCSHCEDVSDQIEVRSSKEGAVNFTLPSNLSAIPGSSTFVMGASDYTIQAILGWNKNGTAHPLSDTPWGKRGFGAAECSVDPCVRSYTGIVKDGTFTETLISTSVTWDWKDYEDDSIDVACLNASEIQALQNAGCNFDPKKTVWVECDGARATAMPRSECIYQAVGPQVSHLFGYLSTMFNGELGYAPGALYGPAILQTIFQGGNVTYSTIDDMFNRIAQSLTVWAREQGTRNVTGQVYMSNTCVNARWGWLACPLSLMLGTVIFLAWTMDHTRRNEGSRQDYKSSPLALLFHRLGEVGNEGPISDIASSGELQKKAKAMRVVFQGTDDVWRFTEVEQLDTSGAKKPRV